MGLHTFSLDDELMQKFDKKTENGQKSQIVETLIREHYLGNEAKQRARKFVNYSGLSKNRKQLAQEIIDLDKSSIKKPKLFKRVKRKAIYSQKESCKQGLNALHHNEKIPIKIENQEIIKDGKTCHNCDSKITFGILENNDMECPVCEQKYKM